MKSVSSVWIHDQMFGKIKTNLSYGMSKERDMVNIDLFTPQNTNWNLNTHNLRNQNKKNSFSLEPLK